MNEKLNMSTILFSNFWNPACPWSNVWNTGTEYNVGIIFKKIT